MPILQEQKSAKSHFRLFFELCKGLIRFKMNIQVAIVGSAVDSAIAGVYWDFSRYGS